MNKIALGRLCKTHIDMNKVKLGNKVRSIVSGFKGTITAKCEYLHSTTTYAVTAPEPVNGEVKIEWFSASELIIED